MLGFSFLILSLIFSLSVDIADAQIPAIDNIKVARAVTDASWLIRKFNNKTHNGKDLSVLSVSWEGGKVRVYDPKNEAFITVILNKAGGMAAVAQALPEEMYEYGKTDNINIVMHRITPLIYGASAVDYGNGMQEFNLLDLVDRGVFSLYGIYHKKYAGTEYEVSVYRAKTRDGYQYILNSQVCSRVFGTGTYTSNNSGMEIWKPKAPYTLNNRGNIANGSLAYEQNGFEYGWHSATLAEERAYVVLGKVVADLYTLLSGDFVILHDYHFALSVFYNKSMVPIAIGHNFRYPGLLSVNLRTPEYKRIENLAWRLDLSQEDVEKYFVGEGTHGAAGLWNALLEFAQEKTGIGATPVSPDYAKEVQMSMNDILRMYRKNLPEELREEPHYFSVINIHSRIKAFYQKHFGIELSDGFIRQLEPRTFADGFNNIKTANLYGILNGLSPSLHAKHNGKLNKILVNPEAFGFKNPNTVTYLKMIKDMGEFGDNLNFSSSDMPRTTKVKEVLRKVLLMEYFPNMPEIWDNKDIFIIYGYGRNDEIQKFWSLPVALMDKLAQNNVKNIAIVLQIPNTGDLSPLSMAMLEKVKEYKDKGYPFAISFDFNYNVNIFTAGADAVTLTSRFEPCGLTDAEAYWLGTLVIGNLTGGISKGLLSNNESLVFGFRGDISSPDLMLEQLYSEVMRAKHMKDNLPSTWLDLQKKALEFDAVSYRRVSFEYLKLAFSAMLKPFFNKITELKFLLDIETDFHQKSLIRRIIWDLLHKVPDFGFEATKSLISYFKDKNKTDRAYLYNFTVDELEQLKRTPLQVLEGDLNLDLERRFWEVVSYGCW